MTLQFSEDNPWGPAFSTDDTVAAFSLPFAFPLDITSLASDIYAADTGSTSRKRAPGDFALLSIPSNPARTDVTARTILLQFQNVPFQSVNNGGFSSFITQVTDDVSKTFTLRGAADSKFKLSSPHSLREQLTHSVCPYSCRWYRCRCSQSGRYRFRRFNFASWIARSQRSTCDRL